MTNDPIGLTRRRFRRALLTEGALTGFAWGCGCAALVIIGFRLFCPHAPGWWPSAALALLLAGPVCGALVRLRRMPSRDALAALTDDVSHAGGLVLVQGLPGADRWPMPSLRSPDVPLRLRSRVPGLAAALLSVLAALSVPKTWFEASAAAKPEFPDVTAPLRNELAEIREEELLPPDEIEAIEEEIARIEAAADPMKPAETLDAVDRLAERLAALIDLNEATASRLTADRRELAVPENAAELAEQFKDMLASAPSSEDSMKDCVPTDDNGWGRGNGDGEGTGEGDGEGEGTGDGDGEGDRPGSGAPTRGPGDAPMDWKKPTDMSDSKFRDEARAARSAAGDGVEKTGESIAAEDPRERAVRTGGAGSTAVNGRSTGASVNRPVLPRHRATVRRYFEPERNGK